MGKNKVNIKIVIVFMSFCQGLQYSIVPVLENIQGYYSNESIATVQMLLTIPAVMAAIIAVVSGWLVTKVRKKLMILIGAFITGISGIIPFFNVSFSVLFTSRVFLGIGLGLLTALNTAVVMEHFAGKERVAVMGLQGASSGAGMLLITTTSGFLGALGFRYAYLIHILGFIATLLILKLLPDTGKLELKHNESTKLNKQVFKILVLTTVEIVFIMSFSTNIAMHIGGELAGRSTVAGVIAGVFSAIQIAVGLLLGSISKHTKENTLIVAMLSFGVGAMLLALFPGSYSMLILGAVFCGISQGIFVPRAIYEAASAVNAVSTAMAAAAMTVAICIGQIISPVVLNGFSKVLFGKAETTYAFTIGAIVMFVLPLFLFVMKKARGKSTETVI